MNVRRRYRPALLGCAGLLAGLLGVSGTAGAADITAGPPSGLSVTIYRAPERKTGEALDLDHLQGFALITEVRSLSLPAGESRVRFPGVADDIESPSAILAGLPDGVLEKNRDARVLSPAALAAAHLGQPVVLVRTNRRTGRSTRTPGTLRATGEGLVFESSEGIEALRCTGLQEGFSYLDAVDLMPTPTLSVRVRSEQAVAAQVTLSYLAQGFDWEATYTATVAPDGQSVDLGAWVTLANGNGVSFPDSRTAVVAGRLNRVAGPTEPPATGGAVLARCWPRGSTSDIPVLRPPPPQPPRDILSNSPVEEVIVTGSTRHKHRARHIEVQEEQLGDLKLYRVPERTGVQARQMKQVRLLDREDIPVERIHVADLVAGEQDGPSAARQVLRTRNDAAHHLGLPLPAGRMDTFVDHGDTSLLLERSSQPDTAVDEALEIGAGEAPDVQVLAVQERRTLFSRSPPRVPGVRPLRNARRDDVFRIEVTNALDTAVAFEARLAIPQDSQLIEADPLPVVRGGRQVLAVTVPARGLAVLRYRTESLP